MKKRLYLPKREPTTTGQWFLYSFCPNCTLRAEKLLNELNIQFRMKDADMEVFGPNRKDLDSLFYSNQIWAEEDK